MARKTKEVVNAEIVEEAIKRFDAAWSGQEDEREQSLQDRRFASIAGATWEGAIGDTFGTKPKLELSIVPREVRRLLGEWRDNRITVDFLPKSGKGDDETADTCDGLYRADEQDSRAEEAMDNAFQEGVTGGFGAWRLTNEYEDEDDDEDDRQRVRFDAIYEADRFVFFGPSSRYDKSDAPYCFVLLPIPRAEYEDQYGDDPDSWPEPVQKGQFDWVTPDVVYVAEYFKVIEAKVTILTWRHIDGAEEKFRADDLDEAAEAELAQKGSVLIGERQVKRKKVVKYILSRGGVLEGPIDIAGPNIPVIPFYAERAVVEGIERYWGIVRNVKDAVRLKNMTVSALALLSAQSGSDKPIVTPGQMAGNETYWENDAKNNYTALPLGIDYTEDGQAIIGPIGVKQATQIPPAMAALIQQASADAMDILGNQDAGDAVEANLSGRAIELVQMRLDGLSLIYLSNFAKAVKRCGEVWLGMASEIYVEEGREMKTIGRQDETDTVTLMQPINGGDAYRNDLSRAKMDVAVDVGPASSSRRSATVRALGSMLPMVADPSDAAVLTATIMRNIEGEGISAVREYFRKKMVKMGVEEPTEADLKDAAEAAQAQQPDPQAMLAMAMSKEAEGKAMKAMAEAEESVADTQYTKARTAETLSKISREDRAEAVDSAVKLGNAIRNPA